jgi:hypothetical protein
LVQLERGGLLPEQWLLSTINKLAPQDRLLERDCDRFLREAGVRLASASKPAFKVALKSRGPQRVHRTQAIPPLDWLCATGTNEYFFAAGYRDHKLHLARRRWAELHEIARVWWSVPQTNRPILLAPCPVDRHEMWVQVRGVAPFPPQFTAEPGPTARTPPWSSLETIALARAEQGVSWAISAGEGLVASAFAADGTPLFSREMPIESLDLLPTQTIPLHADVDGLFFALGDRLICMDGRQRASRIPFGAPIVALCSSPPQTRQRIAVSFAEGGAVYWKDSSTVRRFGHGLSEPRTVFTSSGHLVAVDARRIEIYRADRHELKLESTAESPGQPLAVMRVGTNEFAILDATGLLGVYRIATR